MPKKISKIRLKRLDELADDIVSDMDIDALIDYARGQMICLLSSLSKKEFEDQWNDYYGDDSKECDHVVAIQANPNGFKKDITLQMYKTGEVSHTFQDEMLDQCTKCNQKINWEQIHNDLGI